MSEGKSVPPPLQSPRVQRVHRCLRFPWGSPCGKRRRNGIEPRTCPNKSFPRGFGAGQGLNAAAATIEHQQRLTCPTRLECLEYLTASACRPAMSKVTKAAPAGIGHRRAETRNLSSCVCVGWGCVGKDRTPLRSQLGPKIL